MSSKNFIYFKTILLGFFKQNLRHRLEKITLLIPKHTVLFPLHISACVILKTSGLDLDFKAALSNSIGPSVINWFGLSGWK